MQTLPTYHTGEGADLTVLAKQKQNSDYGGKTWVAGKTEPITGEPDEGCPSGRTIGQMGRWHHPGEIRTYFLGCNTGWTRRGVPLW